MEIGLLDRFAAHSHEDSEILSLLRQLETFRRETGALVLFLDNTAMGTCYMDSMRAHDPKGERVLDLLLDDVYGGLADRVSVEIAAFDSYDEYGAGSLASAKTLWRQSLDREGLEQMLADSP